jgi:hypothetical protein
VSSGDTDGSKKNEEQNAGCSPVRSQVSVVTEKMTEPKAGDRESSHAMTAVRSGWQGIRCEARWLGRFNLICILSIGTPEECRPVFSEDSVCIRATRTVFRASSLKFFPSGVRGRGRLSPLPVGTLSVGWVNPGKTAQSRKVTSGPSDHDCQRRDRLESVNYVASPRLTEKV